MPTKCSRYTVCYFQNCTTSITHSCGILLLAQAHPEMSCIYTSISAMCGSTLNTHSKDFIRTYNEHVTSLKRKNCLVLARSAVACSIHIAVILYVRVMSVWRHVRGKIASSPHFDLPSAAELWELRWQCVPFACGFLVHCPWLLL